MFVITTEHPVLLFPFSRSPIGHVSRSFRSLSCFLRHPPRCTHHVLHTMRRRSTCVATCPAAAFRLLCVLVASLPAVAQECVAKEPDCCYARMSAIGLNVVAPPLGPIKAPASSSGQCLDTCVFSEVVSFDPSVGGTVTFDSLASPRHTINAWNRRRLNHVVGLPSTCGASLDVSLSRITLQPGTYLITGTAPNSGSVGAIRAARVDGDGCYVETLALGNVGFSRPPSAQNLPGDNAQNGYPRTAEVRAGAFPNPGALFTAPL